MPAHVTRSGGGRFTTAEAPEHLRQPHRESTSTRWPSGPDASRLQPFAVSDPTNSEAASQERDGLVTVEWTATMARISARALAHSATAAIRGGVR